MTWQQELGRQIKAQREFRKMSQQQLADLIGVTRPTIDNIEKGSRAAAVNKITEIAKVLDRHFMVLGCRIEKEPESAAAGGLSLVPQQLRLEFDCEYQFAETTLKLTRMDGDEIEMRAVFSSKRSA